MIPSGRPTKKVYRCRSSSDLLDQGHMSLHLRGWWWVYDPPDDCYDDYDVKHADYDDCHDYKLWLSWLWLFMMIMMILIIHIVMMMMVILDAHGLTMFDTLTFIFQHQMGQMGCRP